MERRVEPEESEYSGEGSSPRFLLFALLSSQSSVLYRGLALHVRYMLGRAPLHLSTWQALLRGTVGPSLGLSVQRGQLSDVDESGPSHRWVLIFFFVTGQSTYFLFSISDFFFHLSQTSIYSWQETVRQTIWLEETSSGLYLNERRVLIN